MEDRDAFALWGGQVGVAAVDAFDAATRPKVEHEIAHLMRRRHGGRSARAPGTTKIAANFAQLAAAVNLAAWLCSP